MVRRVFQLFWLNTETNLEYTYYDKKIVSFE